MRLSANPTVRSGIPPEDKGAIRRQGCRPQKKRLIIPSSTGGGREPPRAAGLLNQQRLRHFGDVALCARIPQSGRFEALSSPSGCFKRTLRGHSAMRPTAGRLAPRPQSVRARLAGRRTSSRARPGQIRLRPRSVPEASPEASEARRCSNGLASPRRPAARGRPPERKKGRRPGMRATAWGREGGGPGRPPLQGKGPAPGSPPRTGTGPGREGRPAPRDRRGDGRPAPRAARASRRPSWSPAARPAAPEGAARSRRSARRCRSRR